MIFSETALLTQIYALVAGTRVTLDRNVNGRMTINVDLTGLSSTDISDFTAAVNGNANVAANTAARHTHSNLSVLNSFADVSGALSYNGNQILTQNPFIGQGQDGNVTISANTTLTRDMYYDTLVVNAGIRLSANGYRIFAKTSVTVNGIVSNNGTNASAATAGT